MIYEITVGVVEEFEVDRLFVMSLEHSIFDLLDFQFSPIFLLLSLLIAVTLRTM